MISRKLTADPFRQDTTGQTTRLENLYQKVAISILVFVPLAATVYAIYAAWGSLVDWLDLTLLFVIYVLVGLGVTIGFHRYLAHGSFKTHTPLKLLLVILGTMSWEGGPISWVAIHRKHHAYSDQEGDIHSPQLSSNLLKGFVHAQVGWMFGTKRPDNNKWARDLVNDRSHGLHPSHQLDLVCPEPRDTLPNRRMERTALGRAGPGVPDTSRDVVGELGLPRVWGSTLQHQ